MPLDELNSREIGWRIAAPFVIHVELIDSVQINERILTM